MAYDRRQALISMAAVACAPTVATAQTGSVAQRLKELGITIPKVMAPIGSYVPFTRQGNTLYIAGQIPVIDGQLFAAGLVPTQVSLETARLAARQCALNILAACALACEGDLDRIERCLKVTGYVACTSDFKDQPTVLNGASDLLGAVFLERGQHARAAVGVASLPRGAPVEVEAIFSLRTT